MNEPKRASPENVWLRFEGHSGDSVEIACKLIGGPSEHLLGTLGHSKGYAT